MKNEEKILKLKIILAEQIEWYKKNKILEKKGERDSSYIYDCLYKEFNNLRRNDFLEIIETLIK